MTAPRVSLPVRLHLPGESRIDQTGVHAVSYRARLTLPLARRDRTPPELPS